MHKAHHNVYAHYGLRSTHQKLVYYYADALGQAYSIKESRVPSTLVWESCLDIRIVPIVGIFEWSCL